MSDLLDVASIAEQHNRDIALQAAKHRPQEPAQTIEDGCVMCVECGEEVPPARLSILPNTPYCVECKTILGRPHG